MAEDWAAVAAAIRQRRKELGLTQTELGVRSRVSKQIIGELEKNSVARRRGARTLEAVSKALGEHPGYLAAILAGLEPPRVDEPVPTSEGDHPGHMSVIEHYLRQMLDEMHTMNSWMEQLATRVDAVERRDEKDRRRS